MFVGGTPLSVGASGALWGLMTAGFGLVRGGRPSPFPRALAARLKQRLIVILILNAILSFMPGIDLWAHFGGGAVGYLLAISGFLTPSDRADDRGVRTLARASALLLTVSVAVALLTGRPWDL